MMVNCNIKQKGTKKVYYERRSALSRTSYVLGFLVFLFFGIIDYSLVMGILVSTVIRVTMLVIAFIYFLKLARSTYLIIEYDVTRNQVLIKRKHLLRTEQKEITLLDQPLCEYYGVKEVMRLVFKDNRYEDLIQEEDAFGGETRWVKNAVVAGRIVWVVKDGESGEQTVLFSHDGVSKKDVQKINKMLSMVFNTPPRPGGVTQETFKIPEIRETDSIRIFLRILQWGLLYWVLGIPVLGVISAGLMKRGGPENIQDLTRKGLLLGFGALFSFFVTFILLVVILVLLIYRSHGILTPHSIMGKHKTENFDVLRRGYLYYSSVLLLIAMILSGVFLLPMVEYALNLFKYHKALTLINQFFVIFLNKLVFLSWLGFLLWLVLFPFVTVWLLRESKAFLSMLFVLDDLQEKELTSNMESSNQGEEK